MHGSLALIGAHVPLPAPMRIFKTDTLFGADLTIMEEGTELLHRLEARAAQQAGAPPTEGDGHAAILPMFTSCCPGRPRTVGAWGGNGMACGLVLVDCCCSD